MELNAEQIKKELEGLAKFRTCPEYIKNALTLITSQEQKIKELTEENERLMREKTALECVVATARNQAKTGTVRKMQEMLKKYLDDFYNSGEDALLDVSDLIDQIAKEMLEDKPCT